MQLYNAYIRAVPKVCMYMWAVSEIMGMHFHIIPNMKFFHVHSDDSEGHYHGRKYMYICSTVMRKYSKSKDWTWNECGPKGCQSS